MKIRLLHINLIQQGDTVICSDNVHRTVCPKDIKFSSFMGRTLFGDSYALGHKLVPTIVYNPKCL